MDILPQYELPDPASVWASWHQGIETQRLLLKPLDQNLVDDWLALHEDPEVAKYIVGPPLNAADCWRDLAFAIGHAILRGFSMWAVFEKDSGKFIGRVGPWMPAGWPGLEIGWALGPDGRGQGYGLEGVGAALGWAREHLHIPAVIHSIHPDNLKSKHLATRLGAKEIGTAEISGELHEVWMSELGA